MMTLLSSKFFDKNDTSYEKIIDQSNIFFNFYGIYRTFGRHLYSSGTLRVTTFSIMAYLKDSAKPTLSKNDTQHYGIDCHYAEYPN